MALFPSIWELLLPNLNLLTIFGGILLILSIMSFFSNKEIMKAIALPGLLISIIIIWGFSILADLLKTTGGVIIIIGLLITAIIYVYMFYIYKPKK